MPRGWKQRREYKPGAPLYATQDLRFSGRPVARGEVIPPEYIRSARDHLVLWRAGKARHEPRNVYAPPVVVAELGVPGAVPAPLPSSPATAPRPQPKRRG